MFWNNFGEDRSGAIVNLEGATLDIRDDITYIGNYIVRAPLAYPGEGRVGATSSFIVEEALPHLFERSLVPFLGPNRIQLGLPIGLIRIHRAVIRRCKSSRRSSLNLHVRTSSSITTADCLWIPTGLLPLFHSP